MRRREKFVLASILLSLGLFSVQYVSLEWRYPFVALFGILTYFISAWALSDDLQKIEWLTIIPLPALYASAVGAFYFLLPENILSKLIDLFIFGLGTYALYLTANIYSVAKGRTIQLLRAAHTIGLFFTLFTSLLFLNTIFSHRLPFFFNGLLVGLVHFPLIFLFLWSVKIEPRIEPKIVQLSIIFTLLMVEMAVAFSFLPFSVWNTALFLMTFLYIGLGLLQNYLQERLFRNTMIEFSGVGLFLIMLFFLLLPWK